MLISQTNDALAGAPDLASDMTGCCDGHTGAPAVVTTLALQS